MGQDGSRWPQEGPGWPQDGPRWPEMAPTWPQEALPEALLGPSWGSKLGSQRLRKCAFRVSKTLFFAFGGRLGAEAKPTKTEEPQEEAKDGQKVAPRGSRGGLGMRDPDRREVRGRLREQVSAGLAPGSASRTRFNQLKTTTTHPPMRDLTRPGPKARRI